MVRKVITELQDDIDGSVEDVRSVRIMVPYEYAEVQRSWHGPTTDYEIDLSRENRDALVAALAPFIAKARFVSGHDPKSLRPGEGEKIREWAEKKKIELKSRGRIPSAIVEQFREETDY